MAILSLIGMIALLQPGHPDDAPEWDVDWFLQVGHVRALAPHPAGGMWVVGSGRESGDLWHVDHRTVERAAALREPRPWPIQPVPPEAQLDAWIDPLHVDWGLRAAAVDDESRLWVATGSGLLEVAPDGPVLHVSLRPIAGFGPSLFHYSQTQPPRRAGSATVMAAGPHGIWAWGSELGLLRRTCGVWHPYSGYFPRDRDNQLLDDLIGDAHITAMACHPDGRVALGAASGAVLLLTQTEAHGGTDVHLHSRHETETTGISGAISDLEWDSRGRLWAASRGRYDAFGDMPGTVAVMDGDSWRAWPPRSAGLPPRPISAVCEVETGRVWIGVDWHDGYSGGSPPPQTGLLELVGDEWRYVDPPAFHRELQYVHDREQRLWRQSVTNQCWRHVDALRADGQGRVWVGTHAGLAVFSGSEGSTAPPTNP
ncbi:MAG: hypothetical protein GF320_12225 [Armatimonadia bacterium]|nr:hypothetical protein [Armatimonadia bacterium]